MTVKRQSLSVQREESKLAGSAIHDLRFTSMRDYLDLIDIKA